MLNNNIGMLYIDSSISNTLFVFYAPLFLLYNTECTEVWRCRDHHKVSVFQSTV